MINKLELLKSIESTGSLSSDTREVKININVNTDSIIDRSSGKVRIRPSRIKRFELILSSPFELISGAEIRCLHCKRVLSYPAWHFVELTKGNEFHFFICFSLTDEVGKIHLECK